MYSRELSDIVGELLSRVAAQRPSAEKTLQKAMLQAEIKRMIEENKKSGKGQGGENEVEDQGRRGRECHSARDQPRSNSAQPRGVLQERNLSNEHRGEQRRPSSRDGHKGGPGSRAPSPHKEVAKQIAGPSRVPSPRHHGGENQPRSARQEYIPSSARQEYIPHSARQGYQPQPQSARQDYARRR